MPTFLNTDEITETAVKSTIKIGDLLPNEVRTRFAPSPTGFLHIGGLRTALYNYLIARHYGGKFLLRIEDTDQARFVKDGVAAIFETLYWADLYPDEYPNYNEKIEYIDDNGKFGPYVQSQRLDIYKSFANKLIEEDKAYYCFCTPERLEKMRAEQTAKKIPTHYDKSCRNLSKAETEQKLKAGTKYVVRFKTPTEGETELNDVIRGTVKFKNSLIDDYILMKSDGFPTYHLASVVDDHLMEISHVARGEEWLPSAPVHIMLYKAFDWIAPQIAHLPNILGTDKKKLSKRTGDVAVSQYIEKGYLAEAVINFILLLGWNPGTEKEIYSLDEMIDEFSLDKVGKSGAIFDLKKLDWMNGYYIRKMDLDEITKLCIPYLIKARLIDKTANIDKYKVTATGEEVELSWLKKIIALEQERMKKLSDIVDSTKYFFSDTLDYEAGLLIWKKSTLDKTALNLSETFIILEKIDKSMFVKGYLEKTLQPLTEKLGVGDVLWPLRVALSGAKFSPNPFEIAEVLGKEKVLKRVKTAIEKTKKI